MLMHDGLVERLLSYGRSGPAGYESGECDSAHHVRSPREWFAARGPSPHMSTMQFSRSDLADFTYFLAIAKHRSFRRAGLELGISASALSHALKGLESRLGVRLLNRTNRSVTLPAAGEQLREAISSPFDAIGQAVEDLNRFRDGPSGRIRLNVPSDAATLLL